MARFTIHAHNIRFSFCKDGTSTLLHGNRMEQQFSVEQIREFMMGLLDTGNLLGNGSFSKIGGIGE